MTKTEIQRRARMIRKLTGYRAGYIWEAQGAREEHGEWDVNGILNQDAPSEIIDSWAGDLLTWDDLLKDLVPGIQVDCYVTEIVDIQYQHTELITNVYFCIGTKEDEDMGWFQEVCGAKHMVNFKTGEVTRV